MTPLPPLALAGALVLLVGALLVAAYRWGRHAERARVQAIMSKMDREVRDAKELARCDPLAVTGAPVAF